jgi:hypothetical protein
MEVGGVMRELARSVLREVLCASWREADCVCFSHHTHNVRAIVSLFRHEFDQYSDIDFRWTHQITWFFQH